CGACGNACKGSSVCCGGACADITSDAKNCGACARDCNPLAVDGGVPGKGLQCMNGMCGCADGRKACTGLDTCAGDLDRCPLECVDTNTDPTNCGSCGIACNGKACTQGSCK